MFAWVTGSSLRLRRLIAPLAVGLIAFGVWQAGHIDRDILPEFSPTMVEVQTEALGLSAEEVEQLVTSPLEQDLLNGVAFLESIESASLPGLSSVILTFEEGTDILDARQVVNERLTQAVGAAGLPQVASLPQMLQPLSSTSRVAMVSMSSTSISPIDMSVLARWVVGPRLLGVEGVANVSIWGFRDRQLQVLVDPAQLADREVTLSQVIRTAGNALEVSPLSFLEASTPGTGGFIDMANQRLHIFHEQAISTPDELGTVPLEGPDGEVLEIAGRPITLGDVTQIVEDHQPLIGDAHCTGEAPCLLLVVEKFPMENTPEVEAGIESALAELAPGLGGIDLESSIYRPADFLETGLGNLGWALGIGAAAALLLLLFFLGWRIAAVTVVTVATAAALSIITVQAFDLTLNLMIIAGLVLALVPVVDDAITGAVSIPSEYLRETGARDRFAVWRAAMSATLEARRVAWYGTLIAGAALLPVFFVRGEAGAFLPPVGWGYALGVVAGLVTALVVAPGVSMLLFDRTSIEKGPGTLATRRSRIRAGVTVQYRPLVGHALGRARVAIAGVAVVILAAGIALFFLDGSMRPNLQERDLVVKLQADPGTGLQAMSDTTRQMMDGIAAVTGVDDVAAHVGRAITSDQIVNVNSAALWVSMSEDAPYRETRASIEEVADAVGGVESTLVTYSDERISQLLGREVEGLVVRVYGEDADGLPDAANRIAGSLGGITGVEQAGVESAVTEETLEVEVDIERAQALGLKPGDVRRTAAILMSGITVGNLFEQQKVFDVVVWGAPRIRSTTEDLQNLPITTPSGERVPLSEVADVRVEPNPTVIRHESVSPYLDVAITVADGYEQAEVAESLQSALASAEFTLGFHAQLLGDYSEEREARTTVLGLAAVAILAMFLLFQAALNSWRLASLGMVGIAFVIATGIVTVAIFGGDMTVGSLIGLLGGIGLVARGMILLVRHYQYLAGHGSAPGAGLIEQVAMEGMPSTAFTLLSVILIFFPVAVRMGAPGMEVAGPLALSVIGSALGAGAFILLALPALYRWWGAFAPEPDSPDDLFVVDMNQAERVLG